MRRSQLTDRQKYQNAALNQQIERRNGGWLRGDPVPERITMALDLRQLYGPEVDHALGVEEPTVDLWEAGLLMPTREQVAALSMLTQFSVQFFYTPAPPPLTNGFMCGDHGCGLLSKSADPEPGQIPLWGAQ